ncbi:MAG: hypothetical protein ACYC2U_04405 [Candidatus Amoebophilus sp.]
MKRIKLKSIYKIIMLFGLIACKEDEYADIEFNTHLDRKIFLSYYGKKAIQSTGKKREKYLKLYFRGLPRDFETFFKTVNSNCYRDTLYIIDDHISINYSHNCWSVFYPKYRFVKSKEEIPRDKISMKSQQYMNILQYNDFDNIDIHLFDIRDELIKIIPDSIYYEKIVSLAIGGFWDSDEILSLQMQAIGLNNIDLLMHILNQKTDEEIASFWFFRYDGPPHPVLLNIKDSFYKKIKETNPRIAKLMSKGYKALLSEWKNIPIPG